MAPVPSGVPLFEPMYDFTVIDLEDDPITTARDGVLFPCRGQTVIYVDDDDGIAEESEVEEEDSTTSDSTIRSTSSWPEEELEDDIIESAPSPRKDPSEPQNKSPFFFQSKERSIDKANGKRRNDLANPSNNSRKRQRPSDNFDLLDYMTDHEFNMYMDRLSIEDEQKRSPKRQRSPDNLRQHSVSRDVETFSLTIVSEAGTCSVLKLSTGETVELKDGTFLRITTMWEDSGCIVLCGPSLIRQSSLAPKLPRCKGELIWKVNSFSRADGGRQTISEVLVEAKQVVRTRSVTFTNATFPQISRSSHQGRSPGLAPLYCRWKMAQVDQNKQFVTETCIERLSYQEADPAAQIPNDVLRTQWRGESELNGSYKRNMPCGDWVDLDDQEGSGRNTNARVQQMYSFGDCFCGAGGVSRGAKQAGLHVGWGFDADDDAIASYESNFEHGGTLCKCEDVAKFLRHAGSKRYRVDIMHASPPCQPYSAAHTTSQNRERDEANQAVLFSTYQLVEQVKPRLATMEETEGLYARHPQYFFALVRTFVEHGYSVRWGIMNTYPYGVPQTRRRIVIFAAGPGEKLPPFPLATHGDGPGLLPYQTIADAIGSIPRNATHHDTDVHFKDGRKPPYDPHRAAFTLTCGGGEHNYHPSGKRRYTVREMACLQTFPLNHSFALNNKTAARKQIGNAVPPRLAKVLFKTCIKSLQESDREEIASRPSSSKSTNESTLLTTSRHSGEFTFRSSVQRSFSASSEDDYILIDD